MYDNFVPSSYLLKEGLHGYEKTKRFIFNIPEFIMVKRSLNLINSELSKCFYEILIASSACGNNVTNLKSELYTILDDLNIDLNTSEFLYLIRNCNYVFSSIEYRLFTLGRQLNLSVDYIIDEMFWTPNSFIGIEDFIDCSVVFVVMEKTTVR